LLEKAGENLVDNNLLQEYQKEVKKAIEELEN
jgi:hypothetical protein